MVYPVTAAQAGTTMKKQIEDDFGSQQKRNVRQPEVCVDYLSYKFDEMDLAASWRVMTKQKKDVVDGIRLENASWRTWAKQRNNLKTISPQTLNWLKDSDVTWLYGPLHTVIRTEEDPFLNPKKATTEETLGLMLPAMDKKDEERRPALKSALKKVTPVDLLKRSATELSLNTLPATTTTPAAKHVKHRKISISDVNNELRAVSPAVLATHRQPRLRFNHQVEQCVALNDDIIHEEEEDDDDEEPLSYPSSYCSESNVISIRKIAPARLKKSQSDGDTDDVSSISSSSSTASSYNNTMTRSPLVSSPVIKPRYEDTSDIEEEDDEYVTTAAIPIPNNNNRPTTHLMQRNSSNSINYREKSNVAEPALVTTHQTATDINRTTTTNNNNSSFFHQISNWASSYLWSNDNKK